MTHSDETPAPVASWLERPVERILPLSRNLTHRFVGSPTHLRACIDHVHENFQVSEPVPGDRRSSEHGAFLGEWRDPCR